MSAANRVFDHPELVKKIADFGGHSVNNSLMQTTKHLHDYKYYFDKTQKDIDLFVDVLVGDNPEPQKFESLLKFLETTNPKRHDPKQRGGKRLKYPNHVVATGLKDAIKGAFVGENWQVASALLQLFSKLDYTQPMREKHNSFSLTYFKDPFRGDEMFTLSTQLDTLNVKSEFDRIHFIGLDTPIHGFKFMLDVQIKHDGLVTFKCCKVNYVGGPGVAGMQTLKLSLMAVDVDDFHGTVFSPLRNAVMESGQKYKRDDTLHSFISATKRMKWPVINQVEKQEYINNVLQLVFQGKTNFSAPTMHFDDLLVSDSDVDLNFFCETLAKMIIESNFLFKESKAGGSDRELLLANFTDKAI